MSQRDSQVLKLTDGRILGFAEYGSPTGKPVFFFHGFPSSRLEASVILDACHREDLRIIAPERPGFGLSTFNPHHRIIDWPEDVRALAAHLGISRFAILGGSGGAPYALACARALPAEMMSAVGLMAPAGPWKEAGAEGVPLFSRITALLAYYWPASLRATSAGIVGLTRWLLALRPITRRIDRWLEKTSLEKTKKDIEASDTTASTTSSPAATSPLASTSKSNPPSSATATTTTSTKERREALLRLVFESFRQGTAPMVRESQLLTWQGWGFPLEEVSYDKILVWHGAEDRQSPIRMVRYLAQRLPHCELREFEGETHFSLVKHLGAILEELVPRGEEGKRVKAEVET
ncbi:alpha/beta hydrolase [Xylariaceae sp. FL1651]|nr:alpha/beta hydrolase [Xylariaceae sp. FL1651]